MTVLLEQITLYIYHLSPAELAGYAVCGALILCPIFRRYRDRPWLRPCLGMMLGVWFLVVLWMTMFNRRGSSYASQWIPLHTYWETLSGMNPEALRSALMNVALFYPAGLLCGGLRPEHRRFRSGMLRTVLIFALFSLAVELSQYWFRLGVCETDDVLHNTLGVALGYAASRLEVPIAAAEKMIDRMEKQL